jgi:hypothetical protein
MDVRRAIVDIYDESGTGVGSKSIDTPDLVYWEVGSSVIQSLLHDRIAT